MLETENEVVYVEHCVNCSSHNWCTNHDEEKYKDYFAKCQTSIQNVCPEIIVKSNVMPLITEENNSSFMINPLSFKSHFPRIGSFEIYFRGKYIFSKLSSMKWPNPSQISEKIYEIIEHPHSEAKKIDKKSKTYRIGSTFSKRGKSYRGKKMKSRNPTVIDIDSASKSVDEYSERKNISDLFRKNYKLPAIGRDIGENDIKIPSKIARPKQIEIAATRNILKNDETVKDKRKPVKAFELKNQKNTSIKNKSILDQEDEVLKSIINSKKGKRTKMANENSKQPEDSLIVSNKSSFVNSKQPEVSKVPRKEESNPISNKSFNFENVVKSIVQTEIQKSNEISNVGENKAAEISSNESYDETENQDALKNLINTDNQEKKIYDSDSKISQSSLNSKKSYKSYSQDSKSNKEKPGQNEFNERSKKSLKDLDQENKEMLEKTSSEKEFEDDEAIAKIEKKSEKHETNSDLNAKVGGNEGDYSSDEVFSENDENYKGENYSSDSNENKGNESKVLEQNENSDKSKTSEKSDNSKLIKNEEDIDSIDKDQNAKKSIDGESNHDYSSDHEDDYQASESEKNHPLRSVGKSFTINLTICQENRKKINYENLSDNDSNFILTSSHPEFMAVRDAIIEIPKGTKSKIQLRFSSVFETQTSNYYLYIDRDGEEWECIEIIANYS